MRREVKIGIFAVVMIGALWAGIRFLKGFDIFSRNTVYYAVYYQVDGVQSASPVMIRGVKVGAVTGISINPSEGDKVVLQLTVKRQYKIPENSEARIYSNSLMGAKAIELALGNSNEYLQQDDTLRSSRSKDLMDMAGSEIDFFKQKFSQVVADLSRTMDNLNQIMEQNAANIEGTMSHLNSISGNVDGLLSAERQNLESTIANLTRFTEMLGENSPRMDSIIMNLNNLTGQIAEKDLAGMLDSTLVNLNTMIARINAGEGTAGKLFNDPHLYESLNEATVNLASLLANVQASPGRYVHFSLFGRSDKKDRKEQQKEQTRRAAKAERDSLAAVK